MKALTVQQPAAALIVTDAGNLPPGYKAARTISRNWAVDFRGQFLIHAGNRCSDLLWPRGSHPLTFGSLIGFSEVFDCIHVDRIDRDPKILERWPWLKNEQPVGRFVLILHHVARFRTPIPYTGRSGLFEVEPTHAIRDAINNSVPAFLEKTLFSE